MERKTKVHAEDGHHDLIITREFDLPVHLLFTAYTEADLVEQWMGNKVLKMDSRTHGSYQFETRDPQGNVLFKAHGVIHQLIPNERITRTFEMENTSFPVQLEFLHFEQLTEQTSRLTIQIVFKSPTDRDNMLKLPFAHGINMAHNQLQKVLQKLK